MEFQKLKRVRALPCESKGQVKIQMTSQNVQRSYKLKCLIRDLKSNIFFSQNVDFPHFVIFGLVRRNRWTTLNLRILRIL